jgi:tripeptide aminopeptidase
VLVTLAEMLLQHKLPHPPITLLFTVREESGLHRARELDLADLGGATLCFTVDGRPAAELIVGAVAQENWDVEIFGKASHAGVAPEKGISATLVAATALTEAHSAGWFGKVVKPKGTGTSNPDIFGGKDGKAAGDATNVVTDDVCTKGEARSSDAKFASAIAAAYGEAFEKAGAMVTDASGATAKVKFKAQAAYPPLNLTKDAAVVMHAKRSAELIKPTRTACRQ